MPAMTSHAGVRDLELFWVTRRAMSFDELCCGGPTPSCSAPS
jgi:hypothetical protein